MTTTNDPTRTDWLSSQSSTPNFHGEGGHVKYTLERHVINMKNVRGRPKLSKQRAGRGGSRWKQGKKGQTSHTVSIATEKSSAYHVKAGVQLRGGVCEKYRNLSLNLYYLSKLTTVVRVRARFVTSN